MGTATERDVLRSEAVAPHNKARQEIEEQFVADKRTREDQYHEDIRQNEADRQAALVAAGLNSDGSDPLGRPSG